MMLVACKKPAAKIVLVHKAMWQLRKSSLVR